MRIARINIRRFSGGIGCFDPPHGVSPPHGTDWLCMSVRRVVAQRVALVVVGVVGDRGDHLFGLDVERLRRHRGDALGLGLFLLRRHVVAPARLVERPGRERLVRDQLRAGLLADADPRHRSGRGANA